MNTLGNLLSTARTALDDPVAVGLSACRTHGDANAGFAIQTLDAAIARVDVELDPETALATSCELVRMVAEQLHDATSPGSVRTGMLRSLNAALDELGFVIDEFERSAPTDG